MAETRPISFRVANDVLDTIEGEGASATAIAREALEREARLIRARKALAHMRAHPLDLRYDEDPAASIRRDRDAR